MKKQKIFTIIISIILILSLSACSDNNKENAAVDTDKTTVGAVTSEAAISDAAIEEPTEEAIEKKETKDIDKQDDSTKAESSESKDKDTKKSKSTTKKKKKEEKKKTNENSITIKSGSKKKVFTESDLKDIGLSSYTYSFRNKDSSQRQFTTVKGVKLKTLIDKSGFSGNTIRITSNDGFTKEYGLSDLYSSKKAFKKTYGTKADNVPAVITVGESDSFKLCFGQKADDDDDNGDYNAQYWIKWITTITVQ